MSILRSGLLFLAAAVLEIGGAWLVWQGIREHRGWVWATGGALALIAYGFIVTLQPDVHFGRVLAAYGGVFIAGSLAWAAVADGYHLSRTDLIGAGICLVGAGVIIWGPRSG